MAVQQKIKIFCTKKERNLLFPVGRGGYPTIATYNSPASILSDGGKGGRETAREREREGEIEIELPMPNIGMHDA